MLCEPTVAWRLTIASASTIEAERMYAPVQIVAWGPIVTDDEIRVNMGVVSGFVSVVVVVVVVVVVAVVELSPMMVFSPIMHPSPIWMGPSKE